MDDFCEGVAPGWGFSLMKGLLIVGRNGQSYLIAEAVLNVEKYKWEASLLLWLTSLQCDWDLAPPLVLLLSVCICGHRFN